MSAELSAVLCAVSILAAPKLAGAAVTIDCPADGAMTELSLSFDADVLSVTDATGTTALPATFHGISPDMFAINGAGPMDAVMPEPAALDECLAAKLKEQNATAADTDALAYVANLCRLKLSPSGAVREIEARFEITALDPKAAMVFIQRTYTSPSAVTGAPAQLDEFPPRNCVVLTGP